MDAILYVEWVNIIFGCGSKITECTQSFLFCGGGVKSVFDMYGCCRVAHVNRILPKYTIPYIITITVDVVPKKNIKTLLVYWFRCCGLIRPPLSPPSTPRSSGSSLSPYCHTHCITGHCTPMLQSITRQSIYFTVTTD